MAHGCTGKGNDQVRFELTYKALNPLLKVIAPWRNGTFAPGRMPGLRRGARYAHLASKSEYSRDRNIWHMSHEGSILEDPWMEPKEDMFHLHRRPGTGARQARIRYRPFQKGHARGRQRQGDGPGGVAGKAQRTGRRARRRPGGHGGEPAGGHEVARRLRDTRWHDPLHGASGSGEITLDRETLHYKLVVAQRYAELVYYGQWFTPLREALAAFVAKTQEPVTGTVKVKLFKGRCWVVGRKSPYSLYREEFATFGQDDVYDQSDAEGFINLFGLPLKVKALVDKQNGMLPYIAAPDYGDFKRD